MQVPPTHSLILRGILRIPTLIIRNIHNLEISVIIRIQDLVPADQSPILLTIGTRLTRHDQMLAMLLPWLPAHITHDLRPISMILILSVQCCACSGTVVQRWWFLRSVVSESVGNQFEAVSDAEVETIRDLLGAKHLGLEVDDCCDGVVEGGDHGFDWVYFLPG